MLRTIVEKHSNDWSFKTAMEALNHDFFVYKDDDSLVEDIFLDDINDWRKGATKLCIPLEEFVLKKAICGEKEAGEYDIYGNWINYDYDGYIENRYEENLMETEFNVYQQAKNDCVQNFLPKLYI